MNKKAFTLIEMLVVISIIAVLLGVAMLYGPKYMRTYKYKEDVFQTEMAIKNAKLKAMERSINVSVCTNVKTLTVVDRKRDRSACSCDGTVLITVNLSNYSNYSGNGCRFMFDPRGLAVFGGNVCLSNGDVYTKFTVAAGAGRILVERGSGQCN